jgi:hypothetical protein
MCGHNLLLAHAAAYRLYESKYATVQVGAPWRRLVIFFLPDQTNMLAAMLIQHSHPIRFFGTLHLCAANMATGPQMHCIVCWESGSLSWLGGVRILPPLLRPLCSAPIWLQGSKGLAVLRATAGAWGSVGALAEPDFDKCRCRPLSGWQGGHHRDVRVG